MIKNNGGPAFPTTSDNHNEGCAASTGVTVRDWFAARAPECPTSRLASEQAADRNRNPYNDSHKPPLRSNLEIVAAWNYEYADAMLKVREQQ